jgi:hypothetical protein
MHLCSNRAPKFIVELSINIDTCRCQFHSILTLSPNEPLTLVQQNSLKKGILVPQHETLVRTIRPLRLHCPQSCAVCFHSLLQLFDVLDPPLAERRLSVAIPLLARFFRVHLQ